jgi:hypothetical protein
MSKSVPFENTFLYATMEAGNATSNRPDDVTIVDGDRVSLVRVNTGAVSIYMDVATARSLASQIMQATNDGCDLLWDTEPATGEEVDRWTEDIRAGAIGGDPA